MEGHVLGDPTVELIDFFEMSLDYVCVAGLDGYFKRLSRSWTRTLGWSPEELLARPSIEFVHPDDREKTLSAREMLRSGLDMGPLVNRYLCKDGSHRWFEWRSVANVERGVVYAVARDITEQRLAEEQLRVAQAAQEELQRQLVVSDRMASIGTLAAGVAHEINNPLTYVSSNVSTLREEVERLSSVLPAEQVERLCALARSAESGAARIEKIARGLKTFSRHDEEKRDVIDLVPLLELSVDMTRNEIRHRGRLVKRYGALPLVEGDEARLGQVFVNLLVNAAQALPERDTAANEVCVTTCTDEHGWAVIEVGDTGQGIPAEVIDRVFEPFFTTKPSGIGTGLGLSICHTIVSAMGGRISAESDGRGTTFRVALPPAERRPTSPPAPAVRTAPPVTGAAILVVDDEPAIGAVLRRVLRAHHVTVVTTAREALLRLEAGERFDVVISDLMMPEQSGMELYEELERRFPEVCPRVVFVSGGAFTPGAHAFLERVSNLRLDKPFAPRTVLDTVERLLR